MQRIVLLGASNLTAALPIAAGMAAAGLWGPFRLLAAAGQGRAYAVASHVLARGLPPIAGCGLWRELEREPELPTRALLADIGNDLAYGTSVAETVAAIGGCLERLQAVAANAIMILPPVTSIERLTPARFALARTLLFPGRRFERTTILEQLGDLSFGLARLAAERGVHAVEPEADWFGADRIHFRRRWRRVAWSSLLVRWMPRRPVAEGTGLKRRVRWSFLGAERASLLAVPLRHAQPARRLPDGSTVSYY